MTFKFWACGGIKFDEKCAILQICKCNNHSEVHLFIAAADGSVITELTEDHVAQINSTVENSTVKKEIPWRKKIYNLLPQTMMKPQLSMRKCAVWNMFVDSCSFLHLVMTTFYIFLQQSKTDAGRQDLGNLQLSTKIYNNLQMCYKSFWSNPL